MVESHIHERKIDVFISYSSKDVNEAQALEKLLKARGKKVWRDKEDLRSGEHVDFAIPAALRRAAAVVTIWSAHSAASDWVRHETSYAMIEGKCATLTIRPFDPGTLPLIYRPIHCDDLAQTLADPRRLLERLDALADPAKRRPWIDVSRLPTTYADRLFGRNDEMADLIKAWDSHGADKSNVVVLDAMGGIGKTALVHHFIDTIRERGWQGAEAVYVWSFYSQGTDERRQGSAEQFLDTALKWFGHDGSPLPTQHDKGVRLAELVAGRRTLLVLDGLEPLQYAAGRGGGGRDSRGITGALKEAGLAALFKQLAAQNPGLLIVTTRLKIPDLKAFKTPSVVTYPLVRIATEPGIRLLRSLGVEGTQGELEAAVEDFQGHALALTNLGRYLATHFDGDVRRRDTIPSLMDLEGQQERDPFRVMMAYEILFRRRIEEQKERGQTAAKTAAAKQLALLFLIGLFDRPAEKDAVAAVLAAPAIPGLTEDLDSLSRQQWDTAANALRDLGLLAPKAKDAPDELDAHPLVREFFGMRLRESNPEAWREAHTRLWHHYSAIPGVRDPHSIDELMAVAHGIAHAALAGAHDVAFKLYDRRIKAKINPKGLYAFDISVLLNFFEEPWQSTTTGLSERGQSTVLEHAQSSLRSSGRLAEAAEAIEHHCTILQEQEKWSSYVSQRVKLIQILIKLGRLSKAIAEANAALDIADRHAILWHKADIQCFLGHAYHMTGKVKEADKAFKASTSAAKTHEEHLRLSSFRQFAMNEFYLDQGSKTVVYKYAMKALEAALKEAPSRGVRAVALGSLSLARLGLLKAAEANDSATKTQHLADASRHIESSLTELRNNNQLDELPYALVLRATYRRDIGQFMLARRDLREALDIAEHFGMRLFYVDACLEAARLERSSGVRVFEVPAREYLEAAKKVVDETGYERRRKELERLRQDQPSPPEGQAPSVPDSRASQDTAGEPLPFLRRIIDALRGQ